jgi:hypothetical protein
MEYNEVSTWATWLFIKESAGKKDFSFLSSSFFSPLHPENKIADAKSS